MRSWQAIYLRKSGRTEELCSSLLHKFQVFITAFCWIKYIPLINSRYGFSRTVLFLVHEIHIATLEAPCQKYSIRILIKSVNLSFELLTALSSEHFLFPFHSCRRSRARTPTSPRTRAAWRRLEALGDETLQQIAREMIKAVRANVTIDWTVKESARAKLRVIIRRLLRKYGYPPDKQEKATITVLEQAELLCKDWVDTGN